MTKLLPLILLGSVACADHALQATTFAEARVYGRLPAFAPTLEECQAAREADGILNCDERITFCPDGRAFATFSDIVLGGAYAIEGDELVLELEPNPELPSSATFTAEAGDRLRPSFDREGRVFERRADSSSAASCDPH